MRFVISAIFLIINFSSLGYAFYRIESKNDAINKEAGIIYLVGELHNDKDDVNQNSLLIQLANAGQILLATEGQVDDSSETLFGLEELNTRCIAGSLTSLSAFFTHILYKKIVNTFGPVVLDGESFNTKRYHEMNGDPEYNLRCHLWLIYTYLETAVIEQTDPEEVAFFESLQSNKLVATLGKFQLGLDPSIMNYTGKNSFKDNFYDNMSSEYKDWYVLLKRITNYWKAKLTTSSMMSDAISLNLEHIIMEIDDLYVDIENLKNQSELKVTMEKFFRFKRLTDQITLDLRNEVFLIKICSIYEKIQHSYKPFFVLVGVYHVPFLREGLLKKGYRVAVNDRDTEFIKIDL